MHPARFTPVAMICKKMYSHGVGFDRTNHKVVFFFSRTAYFAFYQYLFLNETVYDNKSHIVQQYAAIIIFTPLHHSVNTI